MPAGLGVQALNLARLSELTGKTELRSAAEQTLASVGLAANRFPVAFSSTLVALDFLRAKPHEVVISGELSDPTTQALLAALRGTFLPHKVVALADARADVELIPPLEGKQPSGSARAFVCQDFVCQAPVETPAAMLAELK